MASTTPPRPLGPHGKTAQYASRPRVAAPAPAAPTQPTAVDLSHGLCVRLVPPLERFPTERLPKGKPSEAHAAVRDVAKKVERLMVHHIIVHAASIKYRRGLGSERNSSKELKSLCVWQPGARPAWTRDQFVEDVDVGIDYCLWNDSIASVLGKTCGRSLHPMPCKRERSGQCPYYHVCPDFSKKLGACPFPSHHGMLVHIRPTCRHLLRNKACPRPLAECRYAHDYEQIRRHRVLVCREEGEHFMRLTQGKLSISGDKCDEVGDPKYWPTPIITEVIYE